MNYTIHQGDALATLRTLPAASVHCIVTSPPYLNPAYVELAHQRIRSTQPALAILPERSHRP